MNSFLRRSWVSAVLLVGTTGLAEAYSFRDYIEARGGCGASRQVLDIELSRLATDIRRAMYVNAGAAPALFGAPASEWSDRDIADAVEIYRMCEERIFRRGFNPGTPTPQSEAALQSYRQVTAQKARTIETKLRGIVEAARQTEQTAIAREEAEQRVRIEAVERARREAAQRETLERLRSAQQQKEATAQAERDRAEAIELRRQVEAESKRLAEAKRVASEAEAERRAAEEALAKVRADRQAEEQRAQIERSQRSIVSENLTVEASPVADRKNCALNLDKFGQLETGMSIEKVESLLGCKGTLTGSSNIGVGTTEVYTWVTRAGDGSVSADFFRKRLHTKAQVGLN